MSRREQPIRDPGEVRSKRDGGTIKIRGLRGKLVDLFFEIATQDHNRTTLSEKGSAMRRGEIINSRARERFLHGNFEWVQSHPVQSPIIG